MQIDICIKTLSRKRFPRIFRRQEAESVAGLINKLVPQESSVFRRNAVNTHNSKLHGPQSNYSILSRELARRSPLKTSNSVVFVKPRLAQEREKLS